MGASAPEGVAALPPKNGAVADFQPGLPSSFWFQAMPEVTATAGRCSQDWEAATRTGRLPGTSVGKLRAPGVPPVLRARTPMGGRSGAHGFSGLGQTRPMAIGSHRPVPIGAIVEDVHDPLVVVLQFQGFA